MNMLIYAKLVLKELFKKFYQQLSIKLAENKI